MYFLLAYRLFHRYIEPYAESFRDLEEALRKALLPYTLEEYVSGAVLTSVILFFVAGGLSFLFSSVLGLSLVFSLLISMATSFLAASVTFLFFYIYPSYLIDNRKRRIEGELPYAVTQMATIAGTGVPPHIMFKMVAEFGEYKELGREFSMIWKDMDFFGADLTTALTKAIKRSPSDKLKTLYWGIISTTRSGGDLRVYLQEQARRLLEERRRVERNYVDTLSMYSELFAVLFLAVPLLFVLLVGIMGFVGGGEFLSPALFLYIFVYVFLPAFAAVFFLMLEASKPEEVV